MKLLIIVSFKFKFRFFILIDRIDFEKVVY